MEEINDLDMFQELKDFDLFDIEFENPFNESDFII